MNDERNYVRKPLEEMNVIDDFLFTEMVTDEVRGPEVCRIILSRVLKREVGEISYEAQKVVPGTSESSHGIRLDVYIREARDPSEGNKSDINVYDVEPDNKSSKKIWLPRRSRYYGSLIDSKLLKTGIDYDKLPDLITIFILSYDPFDKGDMYYEAGTTLKTHSEIPYNDGVRRIFLYVNGKLPENATDDDKKLQDLLKYIGSSVSDNVVDEKIEKLDSIVKETKADKNVGVRYVKSWEWERDIREEVTEAVKKEDSIIIEAERERANEAETRADKAEKDKSRLEAELAKYRAKFGEIA